MIAADLANVQVWVASTPVDMRKSFDGLAEVVRSFLGHDPLSGSLFVFRNKGGHLVKVLWWDRDGLAIYYKRLERGEFQFPRTGKPVIEISCVGPWHVALDWFTILPWLSYSRSSGTSHEVRNLQ